MSDRASGERGPFGYNFERAGGQPPNTNSVSFCRSYNGFANVTKVWARVKASVRTKIERVKKCFSSLDSIKAKPLSNTASTMVTAQPSTKAIKTSRRTLLGAGPNQSQATPIAKATNGSPLTNDVEALSVIRSGTKSEQTATLYYLPVGSAEFT